MADTSDNLTLHFLRRIDSNVASLRGDVSELKQRMSDVERQLGRNAALEMEHFASVMGRMDRLEDRIERIERRVDISNA